MIHHPRTRFSAEECEAGYCRDGAVRYVCRTKLAAQVSRAVLDGRGKNNAKKTFLRRGPTRPMVCRSLLKGAGDILRVRRVLIHSPFIVFVASTVSLEGNKFVCVFVRRCLYNRLKHANM